MRRFPALLLLLVAVGVSGLGRALLVACAPTVSARNSALALLHFHESFQSLLKTHALRKPLVNLVEVIQDILNLRVRTCRRLVVGRAVIIKAVVIAKPSAALNFSAVAAHAAVVVSIAGLVVGVASL